MRLSALCTAVASLAACGLVGAERSQRHHQARGEDRASQVTNSRPSKWFETAEGFASSVGIQIFAAGAVTPDGYQPVFKGARASVASDDSLGTYDLPVYDTVQCAKICDQSEGCVSFNVFIERELSPEPASSDPRNEIQFKCTISANRITAEMAANVRATMETLDVIVAGSNAYNKASPPSLAAYGPPDAFPAAIVAPDDSTYLGYNFFQFSEGGTDSPSQCAVGCSITAGCGFFNSYIVSMDGVPQGLYCARFSRAWGAEFATNYGAVAGDSAFTVSQSHGYTIQ